MRAIDGVSFSLGRGDAQTARLDPALSSTTVLVGDLILAEVLPGF